jgi:hypothetical protein
MIKCKWPVQGASDNDGVDLMSFQLNPGCTFCIMYIAKMTCRCTTRSLKSILMTIEACQNGMFLVGRPLKISYSVNAKALSIANQSQLYQMPSCRHRWRPFDPLSWRLIAVTATLINHDIELNHKIIDGRIFFCSRCMRIMLWLQLSFSFLK